MKTIQITKIVKGGFIFIFSGMAFIIIYFFAGQGGRGLFIAAPFVIFASIVGYLALRSLNKSIDILKNGAPANITIKRIIHAEHQRTGTFRNRGESYKLFTLLMAINVDGKVYELEQKVPIRSVEAIHIQEGITIPAMIDRNDYTKFKFLWIEYKRSIGR